MRSPNSLALTVEFRPLLVGCLRDAQENEACVKTAKAMSAEEFR